MRWKTGLTTLMLGVMLLTGCASDNDQGRQKAISEVAAPFANGGITLKLRAEPGLNSLNEMPNSCTVLLLQARDKPTLDKILGNPATLKSLFAGAGSEGDVLQVDRYVMMPGQTNTVHIDRARDTRNVALVAGYYPFPMKKHMVSAGVPVESESTGWWEPVWQAHLAPVTLSVTLGSESIVSSDVPVAGEKK
ncbi:type VI secretion lipoprotein TssJ [Rahnella aquatilis]|uniref:type VI secretion lipoprotein TssJ n=1 Tax=Rahnella aquatilis TaxID=34038 RepID=UPI0006465C53|nr:type VI secretion lipoprotein TssJ [Rahnella aquatilis]